MAKVTWQARVREGALSAMAIVVLLSVLMAVDYRVRDTAARVARADTSTLAGGSARFTATASRMWMIARDQTIEHAPLTAFTATAGILLLFMLKT